MGSCTGGRYLVWTSNDSRKLDGLTFQLERMGQGLHDGRMIGFKIDKDMTDAGLMLGVSSVMASPLKG